MSSTWYVLDNGDSYGPLFNTTSGKLNIDRFSGDLVLLSVVASFCIHIGLVKACFALVTAQTLITSLVISHVPGASFGGTYVYGLVFIAGTILHYYMISTLQRVSCACSRRNMCMPFKMSNFDPDQIVDPYITGYVWKGVSDVAADDENKVLKDMLDGCERAASATSIESKPSAGAESTENLTLENYLKCHGNEPPVTATDDAPVIESVSN